ncbi:hypothetical protein [Enterobacter sp. J706]|uniref:hypothetical protein n=1 Tax=Enterobacter TaxID=547 RepID=UPI003EBDD261
MTPRDNWAQSINSLYFYLLVNLIYQALRQRTADTVTRLLSGKKEDAESAAMLAITVTS